MNDHILKVINTLNSLIRFDVSFINCEHSFVGNSEIYVHIHELLDNQQCARKWKLLIFPFIVNSNLTGYFVIKVNNSFSNKRNVLLKNILEDTATYIFKDKNLQVNILMPLHGQSLRDYLLVLKRSSNFSKKDAVLQEQYQEHHLPTKILTNIENALSYINENISKPLNLDIVSKAIYISPTYLSRIFKSDLGINFIDYINISKMNLAQEKLISTKIPIIELSNDLGFTQASYFTKIFKRWTGFTPSEYRHKNKNVRAIYTISRSANWSRNISVFEASKQYFANHDISIKIRDINSNDYIYSINNLEDTPNRSNGWIYTVDCSQPTTPSNKVKVQNKSVIQWMYIGDNY